jgi:hypothetical protein
VWKSYIHVVEAYDAGHVAGTTQVLYFSPDAVHLDVVESSYIGCFPVEVQAFMGIDVIFYQIDLKGSMSACLRSLKDVLFLVWNNCLHF